MRHWVNNYLIIFLLICLVITLVVTGFINNQKEKQKIAIKNAFDSGYVVAYQDADSLIGDKCLEIDGRNQIVFKMLLTVKAKERKIQVLNK